MQKVFILVGSKSDFAKIDELEAILKEAKVEFEVKVASCHRNLDTLYALLNSFKKMEPLAIIAIANSISNMPAIVASYLKDTRTVVVGVGLDDKGMSGIDSLLSINTIPKDVPIVTTGVGKVGIYNAGKFIIKLVK